MTGRSILILEDDRDTRELFAASLSKLGAEVRTAGTAPDALAILSTWRPSAILCDLHMPGMDGYAFLERVREQGDLRDVPVIAISASHPQVEHDKALDAGFAMHLPKPSKLSEIIGALSKLTS